MKSNRIVKMLAASVTAAGLFSATPALAQDAADYVLNTASTGGTYHPVGTIVNTDTNAEWRMRFFGIISAAYYVLYVDPDHTFTVIGHPNRKYAWIMSRDSKINEERYSELRGELEEREYELSNFVRMQHQ